MATSNNSVEDIIRTEVERVTSRLVPAIQRAIAEAAAAAPSRGARGTPAPRRRRRRREEITRWVADNRARRVPTFVIEATGLDTKKKIVAKFGENAAFEKGKPLPPARPQDGARKAPPRSAAARELRPDAGAARAARK